MNRRDAGLPTAGWQPPFYAYEGKRSGIFTCPLCLKVRVDPRARRQADGAAYLRLINGQLPNR